MARRIMFLMTLVGLMSLGLDPAIASNDPVRLTFEKSATATPGVWEGTVSGDVEGDLTTILTEVRVAGSVWQVTFDWVIEAGEASFTARLAGTLNLRTGSVVMNGTVVEGNFVGAQVHEAGQLTDPTTSTFSGAITILSASGDA